MHTILQRLMNRKDEKGASAVEYGLLVAAIAALIVVIVFALGGVVQDVFNSTCETIETEVGDGGGAPLEASCTD
jgi:pilus assembly protein Flp/PilA